jgi:hypothetical protein
MEYKTLTRWILACVAFFILVVAGGMAGCPIYHVWTQGLEGQASLKKAEQTRQIIVTQAEAEREAAKARADAIAIVGKAAKEFPEYREQEFLGAFAEALKEGHINQIMYVPTEANIPITEASRLHPTKKGE